MAERIAVVLDLDEGQFRAGVASAVGQLRVLNRRLEEMSRTFNHAERRLNRFGGRVRDFSVVMGQAHNVIRNVWAVTGRWIGAIVRGNAELEKLTALMRGLRTEGTEAARELKALEDLEFNLDFARNAPFTLKEITSSFVKLKASGIDPVNGAMKSLTDAVAAFGGDDQVLHRATIALQQMSGKGVISMEELRQQLGEAIPNAMQLMARATNMTVGQMVKVISEGRVQSAEALRRLMAEFKLEFDGSARDLMQTWIGMMARLRTSALEFSKEIGDAGFMDELKAQVTSLIEFMGSAEGRQAAQQLGEALAKLIKMIGELVQWLIRNREELLSTAKTFAVFWAAAKGFGVLTGLATALNTVRTSFVKFRGAMVGASTAAALMSTSMAALAGPIGIVVAAIGAITFKLHDMKQKAAQARAELRALAEMPQDEQIGESALSRSLEQFAQLDRLSEEFKEHGRDRHLFINRFIEDFRQFGIDIEGLSFDQAQKHIREEMKGLAAPLNNQFSLRAQAAFQQRMEKFANSVDQIQKNVMRRFRAAITTTDKMFNDQQLDLEQRTQLRTALLRQMYGEIIGIHEKEAARLAKVIQDGGGEESKARLEVHRQRIAELNSDLAQLLLNAESNTQLMEKMGASGNKQLVGESIFEKLQRDIAGLRQEVFSAGQPLSSVEQELAEFNELVRQNADDESLVRMADQIRELIRQKFALKEITKEQKEAFEAEASAQQRVEQLQAKILADLESQRATVSGNVYSEVSGGMVSLERSIAQITATLPEGSEKLREFTAVFERLRDAQREIDKIEFDRAMRDRVEAVRQSVMSESELRQAQFDDEVRRVWEEVLQFKEGTKERQQAEANFYAWREQAARAFEAQTPMNRLLNQWRDVTTGIQNLWADTMNDFTDRFLQFIETGKFGWKDFVKSFLAGLAKIATQKAFQAIFSGLLGGLFGGGGSGFTGDIFGGEQFAGFAANGGILTSGGFKRLQKYANGGIATRPQLAVFGEGSVPEAFVPLPDGRTIPVTMSGASAPGEVNVAVNVINRSGQPVDAKQEGAPRFDGRQYVLDIVLDAATRPGRFRDAMKGAIQ